MVVATAIFIVMAIWRQGIAKPRTLAGDERVPLSDFLKRINVRPPTRIPGTAVFLTSVSDTTPSTLVQIMKHMPVHHERSIFLTIEVEDAPRLASADRIEVSKLEADAYRIILHYGFMQRPNIPVALKLCSMLDLEIDVEACLTSAASAMQVTKHLFISVSLCLA